MILDEDMTLDEMELELSILPSISDYIIEEKKDLETVELFVKYFLDSYPMEKYNYLHDALNLAKGLPVDKNSLLKSRAWEFIDTRLYTKAEKLRNASAEEENIFLNKVKKIVSFMDNKEQASYLSSIKLMLHPLMP